MDVAVTGGSGQLGTCLLRRLGRERSVSRIVSIDLRPPAAPSRKVQAVTADVRDPDIGRHLQGCQALVHFAFVVTSFPPRHVMDSVNVAGSQNVFRAAAAAGVRQVVYASSVAAYGVVAGHPIPIVEGTPRVRQQRFAYACNKYDVEAWLDGFETAEPDVAVTRLRPGILVGTHMDHPLGHAFKSRRLPAEGTLPLVWDDDVAEAAWLAIKNGARGAFNLVADEPQEGVALAAAAGFRATVIPRPLGKAFAWTSVALARAGIGAGIDPAWIDASGLALHFSSERARTELGWKPRFTTAVAVLRHLAEEVPRRLDRRLALFVRGASLGAGRVELTPEQRRLALRVHVALTGPGGGDLSFVLQGGRLSISRGIPRPPSVTVTMRAATFLDILAGKVDYATADMTGRIRTEGEALAAFLVNCVVLFFRDAASARGAAAWPARRLARAMARGAPAP